MNATEQILRTWHEAQAVQQRFATPENAQRVAEAATLMAECLRRGGKLLSCGNGGSWCDALHFAEELTGRFRNDRPALAAIALGDAGHLTCVGNDYGFEHVFSRAVQALGRAGDVLLAISTSGNSPNVVNAATVAREQGLQVVALTGKDGGRLAPLAHIELRVPHTGYADRIQEVHIQIIHCLIESIEHELF
jgi:D-sedoheptulose 7-phosphate isomerase